MRQSTKVTMVLVAAVLSVGSGLAFDTGTSEWGDIRPLHGGDAGAYAVTYDGDWRYEGRPEGIAVEGPRFEVQGADRLRAADGRVIEAYPVLWRSEATTLLPDDTWFELQQRRWWDGVQIIATQEAVRHERGSAVEHLASTDYAAHRDCILSGPGERVSDGCVVPGMRVRLAPGTPLTVTKEMHDGVLLQQIHASGPVSMTWWYASDLPVPLRFSFTTTGPHQEPRSASYELAGFRQGEDDGASRGSAIGAAPLPTAPLELWGLSDRHIDHPFPLSHAFDQAVRAPGYDELRDWLRYHPGGYVFRAGYELRDGAPAWTLDLSDGSAGFSLRIEQRTDPLLPMLGGIGIETLEASPLAPSAPPRHAVDAAPTVAGVWSRWADHVGAEERHRGADAWGFEILGDGNGEPVVRVAGGRTDTLHWGPGGGLLGLADGQESSLITLDGTGQTLRFDRYARGPPEHMAAPADPEPVTVAGYAATGWSIDVAGPATRFGLVATALGALALLWPSVQSACLGLFSRLQPHQLLEAPVRATIMDALTEEPGLHFRAICERLGANPGRIRHHVRKLEQGGLVVTRNSPGYTCYYPAATSRVVLDAAPVLRASGARDILGAILRQPGTCGKDVAAMAGVSAPTASYHIKRLQGAGLVDTRRDGRAIRLHLTPGGVQAGHALGIA